MLRKDIIERLREYTHRKILRSSPPKTSWGPMLYADGVFETGSDIFVNLHTTEANNPTEVLHGHDFFEICYVVQGQVHQILDGGEENIYKAGTVFIMNPDARHYISVESERDMALNIGLKKSLFTATFWSLVEQHDNLGSFFLNYFFAHEKSNHFLLYEIQVNKRTEEILELLIEDYLDHKAYSQLSMRCTLILFFTEILRNYDDKMSHRNFSDKTETRIVALFNYLSVNYATATLESTAKYFHYHPNYLSAFIKKNTGRTFREILNDIKLTQAAYYLQNTNMPVRDISERLGFSNLCNFYDLIRKNYNCTPVQFRQRSQDGAVIEKK